MGRRGLILAALLAASAAWAGPPGLTGTGNPQGLRIQTDGTTVTGGSQTSTLNLDGQDFTPTCSNGTCALTLGAAVNLNVGAPGVGNSGDFESTVNLASKTLIIPNSTATANSSCVTGEIYVENDNSATTSTGASICRTTNTQVPVGDIVHGGIAGGQTIAGGTAASDSLVLNPSTSGTATGPVDLCTGTPNPGTTSATCMRLWPSGASIAGTTTSFVGAGSDGTFTQTADGSIGGLPKLLFFRDNTTQVISNSALNASWLGSHTSFYSSPTIQNATDDNIGISVAGVGGYTGFFAAPSYVKSSSGTLSVGDSISFESKPSAIPSGVTISKMYGLKAWGLTNNGTITDNYGSWVGTATGTNIHPYAAAQAALTGSTASGEGDWGVENTSPTQLWFRGSTQSVWRTPILKAADEARASNTTLTNDSTLSFAVAASKKYRFRLVVFFDTAATPDFKYALSCPASPTLVRIVRNHIVPGTTTLVTGVDTACTASTSVTGTGTTGGYVEMEGTIQNGANAGTVAFQWAQDTSNGSNTTVLSGSMLEWATL